MDYSYIIIPIIVAISSQVLKLLTDSIKGNFDLKNLFSAYGGFPSSHTAFAISITTLLGLRLGIDSPVFAAALVFSLIIMRDAVSFRGLLGRQAKLFNQAMSNLANNSQLPKFEERIGHSAFEVFGGVIYGVVVTYLLSIL